MRRHVGRQYGDRNFVARHLKPKVARREFQGLNIRSCTLSSPKINIPSANGILLREVIRSTLQHRAAGLSGANATAEATGITWRLVEAQLVPVIGARGLDVLFRRALHQTTTAFPWLAAAAAGPLPAFMACLAARDPATGGEAAFALLLSFVELLATLIGQSLTERLLAPVWERPSSPSE